jgi:Domain of unknown function (DUF6379)
MKTLEFPAIQSRGFRNVSSDGKVVGFQLPIRLDYYRGVWLSQLRPAKVTVDGRTYEGEAITWTINGIRYEQADLARHSDVNWGITEPAILTVRKPGGLEPGIHDVEVLSQYSASYLPPRLDLMFSKTAKRRLVLVR